MSNAIMPIPRTLNKAQIARALGDCVMPGGGINYRRLRRLYFTDALIEKLKLTRQQYRTNKIFNHQQTKLIVQEFDLQD
ncbi:MAG: hypothetical protein AAFY41_13370, partial [Bacteroidota bacterium]